MKAGVLVATLAVVVAGCGPTPAPVPAAPSGEPPAPPAVAKTPIEDFKFMRLGMTLDELTRLKTEGFDGEHHMRCLEDTAQAMRCRLAGVTIAEAAAEVEGIFLATAPLVPLKQQVVPKQYHPSWQEIRLGREGPEQEKTDESYRTRQRIMAENRADHLRYLAQFALAQIEIVTGSEAEYGVLQALVDRYGDPVKFDTAGMKVWDSPTGRIVFSNAGFQVRVSYTYHPLDSTRESYYSTARENRAGDLYRKPGY